MQQLEQALAEVRGGLGDTLTDAYSKFRSSDPNKWEQVTVAEMANIVAPNRPLDFLTRFAIHKYLMNRSTEFVADALRYRTSQMFHVRPKSQVDRLAKVRQFAHQPKGLIQAFATRAREVIAENRKRAKESWAEHHSEHPRNREVFMSEDRIIIDFLRDSFRTVRTTQQDPYRVPVSTIVKAIDRYEGDVDDTTVYQLLTELGVFAPWQEPTSLDRSLDFEQEPEETASKVAAQNAIAGKARAKLTTSAVNSEVLGPEDFYTHDLLQSIRHDFGNLPVYVVDAAGAEELDDGISVETIPSEPNCAWIHVHVADPTTVIPPSHIFSLQARQMASTAYFNHRTYPMLPSSMMGTLIHSLGDMALDGRPEPVMSFSFKVDGNGDIVDYNVRAGIIRNVLRTTYDAVDIALGQIPYQPDYPFGGQPPSAPTSAIHLNGRQQADIHVLNDVADRMHKRMLKLPIFNLAVPRADVIISPKPLHTNPAVDPLKPPIFSGFPNLTYTVPTPGAMMGGARLIVSQSMMAAGRVASRWALDHGVPLLRRTSVQPMTLSDNDFADLLASRDRFGDLPLDIALSKEIIYSASEYTLEPGMHWAMGIPDGEGYCRVTSPLRRYGDMVAHWQIKHALLHPTIPTSAFSPEWLQNFGMELFGREKMYQRASRAQAHFWALRFIQRWMQNTSSRDGPDPLNHLVGYILTRPQTDGTRGDISTKVIIPRLGLNGHLVRLGGMKLSNFLPGRTRDLKIERTRVGVRSHLFTILK
jgi:hypothetical protein